MINKQIHNPQSSRIGILLYVKRTARFILLWDTRLSGISILLYVGLILTITSPLLAGNSIFSFEGTPCQNYGNDIYGMSMGDVGISDVFRQNTGYGNPAILGNAKQTLFSTGLQMGWTQYTSQAISKQSFRDNSLDFPFFSMAFPYRNHRLGFQFNSVASGEVQKQLSYYSVAEITVLEEQLINRYIYSADIIYAYHYKWLNLGTGLNYYLGHDNHEFRIIWPENSGYINTRELLRNSYKQATMNIGFTATWENLSIGAVYNPEVILKGTAIRNSIHEEEKLGKVEYPLASHLGMGITAKLMGQYKVSSDLHYEMWANTASTTNTHNSLKIGVGLAQEPAAGSGKSWVGKMPKRLGFSYRTLPFEIDNQAVTETAITGGFTLPVKDNNNRLDIGVQYFIRGNVDDHNLQDKGLMLMFGITGFDLLTRDYKRTAPRDIPVVEEIAE